MAYGIHGYLYTFYVAENNFGCWLQFSFSWLLLRLLTTYYNLYMTVVLRYAFGFGIYLVNSGWTD